MMEPDAITLRFTADQIMNLEARLRKIVRQLPDTSTIRSEMNALAERQGEIARDFQRLVTR